MATKISVNKLQAGIDIITSSLSLGVLLDSMEGTAVGDAKAKFGCEVVTMLGLLMEDIKDMDETRALM